MRRAVMWTGIAMAALMLAGRMLVVVRRSEWLDRHHRRRGRLPHRPGEVVVTVDQWADIVRQLGGNCAEVTTIIRAPTSTPTTTSPPRPTTPRSSTPTWS